MKELSKAQIKERAKHLRQILLEKHNFDLPHGHSLEVLAKVFGYKDWNTASAVAEKPTVKELPIAANFQTVGELVDFLSMFDRSKKLVVNEYSWIDPDSRNLGSESNLVGLITSACSLTYDQEIQREEEIRLELRTEVERHDTSLGKSATQKFETTKAGRSQRIIKYFELLKPSIWNNFMRSTSKF